MGAGIAVLTGLLFPVSGLVAQQSAGQAGEIVPGSLHDPEAYPRPTGTASRVATPPRIDGRLDDAAWKGAEVLTDFIQSQPDPGALATERTEVRIVYDDQALYIGGMMYDDDPDGYVVQSLERDFPSLSTRDADIFSITLDTFLDRRNSFMFLINPYGAYRDGQTFNDSRSEDFGFDVPIQVKTALLDNGWSVEVKIPWSGVRYDASKGEQSWGMNLGRRVRRKNEDSYWAPLERRDPLHRMSKAGTLEGLAGLPRGGSLRVKPYALADDNSGIEVDSARAGAGRDVGFDAKYGLTPGLTLDLTVNTDFSQVEVDQQKVNLTRFPLFFPEQRDFFVENSGSFTFGDQTERSYRMGASLHDFTLFHSRRIGLQGGHPVPIIGGGRVSGSVGEWEVGALDMRTDAQGGLPGENFAVVRMKRKVAEGSDVGVMFIDRSAVGGAGPNDGRSYGADANVRLFKALIINSYLAKTATPGATGDETAARVGAAWRSLNWDISGLYRRIGDAFNPTVGFVNRTDIKHTYVTVGTHRRPGVLGIQEINPYVEVHHYATLGDTLVTRQVRGGLQVDLLSGASVSGTVSRRYEMVQQDFPVNGDTVRSGAYDFDEASLEMKTSAGRPFSVDLKVGGGGYYGGTRRSVGGGVRWLASHQLAFNGSADYNRLSLADGTVTSAVYAGRAKYAFSTRTFLALNVQYNQDVDQLTTYARFNVIYGPLSDFFLVLTERRQLGTGAGVLERAITAKVTKLLSF